MSQISERSSTSCSNSPEPGPLKAIPTNEALKSCRQTSNSCRADSGTVHRVRHGILSREVLVGLVRLGEDPKTLRKLERRYRDALRPAGPFGDLFFDLFWSSYLRLMLSGRLQTALMGGKSAGKRNLTASALVPGPQPTLVCQNPDGPPSDGISLMEELPPDLLRDLVLVQRYERPHCRELHRSLALLLLLRRGGEAAIESWATEMLGGQPRQEG